MIKNKNSNNQKNIVRNVFVIVFFLILVVLLIVLNIEKNKNTVYNSKINICTTFHPVQILTERLMYGIDNVEITNITANTTGCIHDYALTTKDMKAIENSDLLILNGASMEEFLNTYLNSNKNINVVDTSYGTSLLKDDHEEEQNSHIYLNINNYIKQMENTYSALVDLDFTGEQKAQIFKNKNEFLNELLELLKYSEKLNTIKSKRVVLSHNSFEYMINNLNVDIVEILEVEHENEISSSKISKIIDENKKKKVDAIFVSKDFDISRIENIVNETNIKVYKLDAITDLAANDYVQTMKNNIDTIYDALK